MSNFLFEKKVDINIEGSIKAFQELSHARREEALDNQRFRAMIVEFNLGSDLPMSDVIKEVANSSNGVIVIGHKDAISRRYHPSSLMVSLELAPNNGVLGHGRYFTEDDRVIVDMTGIKSWRCDIIEGIAASIKEHFPHSIVLVG